MCPFKLKRCRAARPAARNAPLPARPAARTAPARARAVSACGAGAGRGRCVQMCEKIVEAVAETDRYPCVALKVRHTPKT
jgi:hypothetical protein